MSTPSTLTLLPWVHSITNTRTSPTSTRVVPDLARLTTHALEHQVIGAGVERGEDAVDLVEVGLRRSAQVLGQRRSPGLLVAGQPRVVADSGGVAVGTGLEQCREFLAHRVVVLPGFDQATQRTGPIGAQPLGIVVAGNPPGIVVARHHVRPDPVRPEVVRQQRADLGLADPRPAVHGDHRPAVPVTWYGTSSSHSLGKIACALATWPSPIWMLSPGMSPVGTVAGSVTSGSSKAGIASLINYLHARRTRCTARLSPRCHRGTHSVHMGSASTLAVGTDPQICRRHLAPTPTPGSWPERGNDANP